MTVLKGEQVSEKLDLRAFDTNPVGLPLSLAIRHVEPTTCLEVTEPSAKHPQLRDCKSKDLHVG